jgi:hypothetical protein
LAAWSSSSAAWSSSSAAWSSCHRQPGSLSDNEWVFLDNRTKCMSLEGHQKLPCKHRNTNVCIIYDARHHKSCYGNSVIT